MILYKDSEFSTYLHKNCMKNNETDKSQKKKLRDNSDISHTLEKHSHILKNDIRVPRKILLGIFHRFLDKL